MCRRGLARTFQIPRPFRRLSMLENVALAAYLRQRGAHRPRERASSARARRSSWSACRATRPRGVEGLGAAGLKKLELARALATQPKLLLADETLGGLDEAEMEQAADMLRAHPRRARHHHRLGRAHHGRADAGRRPLRGARPRRSHRARQARRGGARPEGDRGLSGHRRRRRCRAGTGAPGGGCRSDRRVHRCSRCATSQRATAASRRCST